MPGGAGAILDEQISLFFGADWVVTIQERADGDCFGSVREAIRQSRGRAREAGADYLAYLLIDAVVDAYFPVIDAVAERMHRSRRRRSAPPPRPCTRCSASPICATTSWRSGGRCGRCAR